MAASATDRIHEAEIDRPFYLRYQYRVFHHSIVQFANELQRQGMAKLAAVAQAARIRLRPVMMTSVATVAGHFPLTLVTGAGAAARNSIGLVLVGGMTIGTIFTLFIVPSLYMLIAKEHHEKSLMDTDIETAEDIDLTPEYAAR